MDSLNKKDAKTQMSSSTSYSKARAELKSHRKSKRSRSTSTSSSSSSEDSSDHKHKRHKRNSKSSKHRKSKAKKKRKSRKHKRPRSKDEVKEVPVLPESNPKSEEEEFIGPSLDTMFTSNMKPMTKEEWDKKQSVVKKVYDPETDRLRLIRGDGEVLEEIVSYKRHQEINKRATAADGTRFQTTLGVDNK